MSLLLLLLLSLSLSLSWVLLLLLLLLFLLLLLLLVLLLLFTSLRCEKGLQAVHNGVCTLSAKSAVYKVCNVGPKWRMKKILAKRENEEKADPQKSNVDHRGLTHSTLNSLLVLGKGRHTDSTTETRGRRKREGSLVRMIKLSIVMRVS